jgi:hypothetical protein
VQRVSEKLVTSCAVCPLSPKTLGQPTCTAWTLDTGQPSPLGHWTLANPHRLDTGHWPTLTAWPLDTGQPSPLGHWTLANPQSSSSIDCIHTNHANSQNPVNNSPHPDGLTVPTTLPKPQLCTSTGCTRRVERPRDATWSGYEMPRVTAR